MTAEYTARYLADYQTPDFTITNVDLSFELFDFETKVTSKLTVKRLKDAATSLILNGEQLSLLTLSLNDKELANDAFKLTDNLLEITTDENDFILTVVTLINPQENSSLEGLFKSGQAFCTQCEAEGFRRITYYLDRPDVMAVFTCEIIADKNLYPYLLSNGNKTDSGDLVDGKHFVKWHDPFPKPCYLFAVVAGDFDLLSDSYTTMTGKNVALEIFVDKGNLAKAHHAMGSLKRAMKWDEDTFDLAYDLDIYMIVAVDFFNMGAMENKGLNVFNSKYVLADESSATDTDYFHIEAVIGHEYFHNWTGNRVTCRDWFQLSLKEGLTVFRDQEFSADMHNREVTRIQNVRHLRSQQFAEDAGPMAHPIRPEQVIEMNNFYTLTVYEKGAEVIRMLNTILGEKAFKAGLSLYFQRFDGMAVTCDDFVQAMADASSIDLTLFTRWYSQVGTPQLSVQQEFNETTGEFTLTIKQRLPIHAQNGYQELHIPINIELLAKSEQGYESSHKSLIELKSSEQSWTFPGYETAPIVSFLGNFSAPVKVNYAQQDSELDVIIAYATDGFCRWDAGQKLLTRYIIKLTENSEYRLPEQLITTFKGLLNSEAEPAFKAEQLILPSFDEVADLIDEVDPIALLTALAKLRLFLARGLKAELYSAYKGDNVIDYSSDDTVKDAVASRSLKNSCLPYLCLLEEHNAVNNQQYTLSNNITDTLAALQCSAKYNLPEFSQQMHDFESKWHDTPLVMDKWFANYACLASGDIFEQLTQLTEHPLFSLKNPNRARSLIGAFSVNNPKYFHCLSGRGYQFLASQITLLNKINPQVASRLITPLIQFKGVDKARQKLMKEQLVILRALPDLSKDLIEKLDAAFA